MNLNSGIIECAECGRFDLEKHRHALGYVQLPLSGRILCSGCFENYEEKVAQLSTAEVKALQQLPWGKC